MTEEKKRLKGAILLCVFCLLVLTTGIVAFFGSVSDRINNVTVGENVTKIEEIFDPPDKIEEGKDYIKKVTIRNQGSVPCYVRAFAETVDPAAAAGIQIDWNRTDWSRRQKDGYYYYHRALAAGETTEPLFTTLSAKKDLKDFRIIVYSESVQAQGSGSPQEAFAPYEEGR